jgi:hypothetical protein
MRPNNRLLKSKGEVDCFFAIAEDLNGISASVYY